MTSSSQRDRSLSSPPRAQRSADKTPSAHRGPIPGTVALGLAFLILVFCTASCSVQEPARTESLYERVVEGNVFDTTPVRGAFRPLRHRRSGFEYRCSECHKDFDSSLRPKEIQGEHRNIVFDHGQNLNCLNCHHPKNRNAYVDQFSEEIPADQPARLCAKCHGPTYRDWQLGVHGRQNGYWDVAQGERPKLLCIQCHDPHRPKFMPMIPDPPPIFSRLEATRARLHE